MSFRAAEEQSLLRGSRAGQIRDMFNRIAPRYDLLNRLLTLGMDKRWRRLSVKALQLPAGSKVLDLACGTGDFCRELRSAQLQPFGLDFAAAMLAHASSAEILLRADVTRLPVASASVDGAVCGFALRNLETPEAMYQEMARAMRPGGRIALLEVSEPRFVPATWIHRAWMRCLVPAVGALLSDRAAYSYLPKSFQLLAPPEELKASLGEAGFVDLQHRTFSLGIAQLYTGTRA